MHDEQRVGRMAGEVLARRARVHAERTGREEAPGAARGTTVGRSLDGPREERSGQEEAGRWQRPLPARRAYEFDRARGEAERERRARERDAERERALREAWESFMRTERQEIRLRREGQLAALLGEALPGESPSALERLASEDRRQAEEGLVALMCNGSLSYKRLEELCAGDMPARGAANRLRDTWLKERQDGWLPHG